MLHGLSTAPAQGTVEQITVNPGDRVLAGQAPVPEALAQQVRHIVRLAQQISARARP